MHHYTLIKKLISEIRELRNEVAGSYRHQERIEQRNQSLRDENNRIERQREYERQEQQSKDWQREDLMHKLEKAERYGDSWSASRVKRDLKNL